jgi:hypothetical protein
MLSREGPELERAFAAAYPRLFDFLEALWVCADGTLNIIELLHAGSYYSDPQQSLEIISEMQRLADDDEFSNAEISWLFNKDGPDEPYVLVTPQNAKGFMRWMSESLAFVRKVAREQRQPR